MNMKKFKDIKTKLFTAAAIALALLGTGASLKSSTSTINAARWYRVYRRRSYKRHYRRYYRRHSHYRHRTYRRKRCPVKHIRYRRRTVRVRRVRPKIKKYGPYSSYVTSMLNAMMAPLKDSTANQLVDFNTATPADMFAPLATNHPSICAEGNSNLKTAVYYAARAWQPEINFQFTNNPNNADIIIRVDRRRQPIDAMAYTNTLSNGQTVITISQANVYQYKYDMHGVTDLVEHELGHAIGLKHNSNQVSIMNPDEGLISNASDQKHFTWRPAPTASDRRMLREMYHEN